MSGSVISNEGSPRIYISHPGGHGAIGPSLAIEAGEREAQKEDNRRKLAASNRVERHLAIYIGATNGLARIALTEGSPPAELPKLPSEMTHIWLTAYDGGSDSKGEFVVWRASTKEIWYRQQVVISRQRDVA
jgi:hypothetical protein